MPPENGPGAQPENPAPGAPVPPVATPPVDPAKAATTSPTSGHPATTPDPAKPETFTREYVEGLRRENADWRTKYQTANTELDGLKREKMTKEQQLEADVKKYADEVVPGLNKRIQHLEVQVTAGKLGIVDPELAALALDWNAIAGGKSVELALNELLALKPWLKQAGTATPAATPPTVTVPPSSSSPATPPASNQPASFTKSQLDKMSQAELERRMAEIDQAIAEHRVDYTR